VTGGCDAGSWARPSHQRLNRLNERDDGTIDAPAQADVGGHERLDRQLPTG